MKYLQQRQGHASPSRSFGAVRVRPALVCLLLGATSLLAVSGCGSQASNGVVTETGNPPLINRSRLTVDGKDGVLTVTGESGSVTKNADVRLTNKNTGESVEGESSSSGSFKLEIDGDADDELELEVGEDADTTSIELAVTSAIAEPDENDDDDDDDDDDDGNNSEPETQEPTGQPTDDTEKCDAILEESNDLMADAIAEVPTSCSVHNDCEVFSQTHPCQFSCSGVGVQAGQVEGLLAVGVEIRRDVCDARSELTCQPLPTGSCLEQYPACVNGECVAQRELPEGMLYCGDLRERATDLESSLLMADQICEADADCALVSGSLSCISSCMDRPISQSAATTIDELRAELEATVCVDFTTQSCPPSQLDCPSDVDFSLGVACIEGLCAPRTEESPDMMNGERSNILCGAPFIGNRCLATEYCAYVEGQSCGGADAAATCLPRPETCDTDVDPVCGCDGKTHSNSCVAAVAGTGISYAGDCFE